ncbi:cytochrome c556 [Rubricella aquisinus]|uniref:Cytochrome c556 n=1 Tax=Rubricella aquisinus TaxID=2028108 RepID=A0A840X8U5_9RHOB|nr:cytochrome c [Rubricella aquisinus]MBB5517147.1 cytochrome c556 [Rubricella aquisinus]
MKTMLKAALIASLSLTAMPAIVSAQDDPVEARQQSMKAVGKATGVVAGMLRGRADFDAMAANAALADMRAAVEGYDMLFPEGSEAFDRSEAGPTIWSDRADFEMKVAAFKSDLDAAIAANPQTLEALGASFGAVGQNCQACHEAHRVDRF